MPKQLNSIPARPVSERVFASPPSGLRKAKQAFKDEVDINSVVRRFTMSGVPIPAPTAKPQYFDMASLPSNLHDALLLKQRLSSLISTFSPSIQAAYRSNPDLFVRSLDAHLAKLQQEGAKKAPDKPVEPVTPAEGTPPPAKA